SEDGLPQTDHITPGTEGLVASRVQQHARHLRIVRPLLELRIQRIHHGQRQRIQVRGCVERGAAEHMAASRAHSVEEDRCRGSHPFFHCGARLSRKACTPSRWSSVSNSWMKASRSATKVCFGKPERAP